MRKKSVLVYGTPEKLMKFLTRRSVQDYEVVGVLGAEEFESFSFLRDGKPLETFTPQNLPSLVYELADGIIFLGCDIKDSVVNFFIERGIDRRKIMLVDDNGNWKSFEQKDATGTRTAYLCGMEFHIRAKEDERFLTQTMTLLKRQNHRSSLNWQDYPRWVASIYKEYSDTPLDFNNCKTFTEKLQWLKLYDATPLKSRLADKYLVRDWVEKKIGGQYLIPLLGVWDNFDDINFDKLPNQFVLKCNAGSDMTVVVNDKNTFKKQQTREKFAAWFAVDFATVNFELHYTRIDKRIIAERLLRNGNAPDLLKYSFWCFGGKPYCCRVVTGEGINSRVDYFDLNWKHLDYEQKNYPNSDKPEQLLAPKNLKQMKELAAKLSEGFAFVSVDLYEANGRVYFGGMNFIPKAGNFSYKSKGTNEQLGKLLELPAPKPMQIKALPRAEYRLRQKFLHEIKLPSTPAKLPEQNVIASLTSWEKRIGSAHLAIKTILNQTHLPDLTVLYLAEEEFPQREKELPKELLALRSKHFEIRWVEKNIRSYKKLIPALKDFPNDVIITFDDDLFFHKDLVKRLITAYIENPQAIHCHRVRNVTFNEGGKLSYSKTAHIPYECPSYLNKLSGGAACLYPPHSLHEDILREDKFMTLAPTNDDLWFWLMGVLNGRRVNVVKDNVDKLDYLPETQEVGLNMINNMGDNLFFRDLENILNAYPVLRDVLRYEQFLATGK